MGHKPTGINEYFSIPQYLEMIEIFSLEPDSRNRPECKTFQTTQLHSLNKVHLYQNFLNVKSLFDKGNDSFPCNDNSAFFIFFSLIFFSF